MCKFNNKFKQTLYRNILTDKRKVNIYFHNIKFDNPLLCNILNLHPPIQLQSKNIGFSQIRQSSRCVYLNKLIFNEMMNWWWHIILIASQSVFLVNAACFADTANTNFIVFGLTRSGFEPAIYWLEASTLTIIDYSKNAFYWLLQI